MTQLVTLRKATIDDVAALDRLFKRSYMTLMKGFYKPSELVSCIPIFAQAQPHLIRSGMYFVAEDGLGIVGAGGWSTHPPGSRNLARTTGHVRHVAVDPSRARRGIGRQLVTQAVAQAREVGLTRLDCQSTRNAVPFYRALGFELTGDTSVELPGGIRFACFSMVMHLT